MPTINFILKDGTTRSIEARIGRSVMENAVSNNVRGIDAECGGSCSCATCHVYVDPAFIGRLQPADDMENEMLDGVASAREAGSRLSCQISMTEELDGLTVRVPETQV